MYTSQSSETQPLLSLPSTWVTKSRHIGACVFSNFGGNSTTTHLPKKWPHDPADSSDSGSFTTPESGLVNPWSFSGSSSPNPRAFLGASRSPTQRDLHRPVSPVLLLLDPEPRRRDAALSAMEKNPSGLLRQALSYLGGIDVALALWKMDDDSKGLFSSFLKNSLCRLFLTVGHTPIY